MRNMEESLYERSNTGLRNYHSFYPSYDEMVSDVIQVNSQKYQT